MTEYVEDVELNTAVTEVLNNKEFGEFSELRNNKVKVLPLMRIKTNKEGEHQPCKGIPAQVKKVSDIHKAAGIDADLILVVDYYAWNHPKGLNPGNTLRAILHFALKTVEVTKNEEGQVKISKVDPDVVMFKDTIKRYGVFEEDLGEVREILNAAAQESTRRLADGNLEEAQPHVEVNPEEAPVGKAVEEAPVASKPKPARLRT